MGKENIESLPVDRHLWYKGRIFIEGIKFADLPETLKNLTLRKMDFDDKMKLG